LQALKLLIHDLMNGPPAGRPPDAFNPPSPTMGRAHATDRAGLLVWTGIRRARNSGLDSDYKFTRGYAKQCLIARRLVERGVRFVELTCQKIGGYDRWDAHSDLTKNHGGNARAVDQPIRALLVDLKQRGVADDTLVVFLGEFGRTPFRPRRRWS
jgi:hypothetical protein